MKPLIATMLLSLLSGYGFAQDEAKTEEPVTLAKNYIYLSPFNLIVGQFQVGYERDFNRRHGIVFLPGVIVDDSYSYSYGNRYSSSAGTNFGFTAELQYRYRMVAVTNPRKKAKNAFRFDFYVAPFAAYQYLNYDGESRYYDNGTWYYEYDSVAIHAVSGGILFGTRFAFFERFSLDAYFGGGIKVSDKQAIYYYYDIFRQGYTGIIGKGNLQIAVAF